ncbi:MAG: hypothetical protein AB8B55_09780 [Mariniblastus sp.]
MCGFVGYLSYQGTQAKEEIEAPPAMTGCKALIENPPSELTRVLVGDYGVGKMIASLDVDEDGKWDEICVPFFPKNLKIGYGYTAVLICFDSVADEASFREIANQGTVDSTFWPTRQKMDPYLHEQLAKKYHNLDFAHSPVLHYGFEKAKPLLGEETMKASIVAAGIAIVVAFLALISGLFKIRLAKNDEIDEDAPTSNRAGLPIASSK